MSQDHHPIRLLQPTAAAPLTFSLDITSFGPLLKICAEETDGDSRRTVRSYVQHEIRLSELHEITDEISVLLNQANKHGEIEDSTMFQLKRAGHRLFDELLPGSIKRELRRTERTTLLLTIDDALVHIPWELLFTGEEFLCLKFRIGRIVRTDQVVLGEARTLRPAPRSMLIVCDPRDDLIVSYYEGITIRDSFDGDPGRLLIDLKSSEVDSTYIKENIREYDLVHYAGHADVDQKQAHKSGWRLADGRLTTEDILRIAGGKSFPAMIFANACRSGHFSRLSLDKQAFGVYGMANAFLLGGVQHFIGTLWDIPDESSCQFGLAFYRHLLDGASIGEAVFQARQTLREQYGPDSILWASYVLYGHPETSYFSRPAVVEELADEPVVMLKPEMPAATPPEPDEERPPAQVIALRQRKLRRKTRGTATFYPGFSQGSTLFDKTARWLLFLLPILTILALLSMLVVSVGYQPNKSTVRPVESLTQPPPVRHQLLDPGPQYNSPILPLR